MNRAILLVGLSLVGIVAIVYFKGHIFGKTPNTTQTSSPTTSDLEAPIDVGAVAEVAASAAPAIQAAVLEASKGAITTAIIPPAEVTKSGPLSEAAYVVRK